MRSLQIPGNSAHRRYHIRLILRKLLRIVLPQHIDKGRTAGGGHLPPLLQSLRPFLCFVISGHISAEADLHHIRKANLLQARTDGSHGDIRTELPLRRRRTHGNNLLAGFYSPDHIHNIGFGGNGAKGTGMNTMSALHTFILIDPADAILIIGDRSCGTCLLTWPFQMGYGGIGAGSRAFSALLTLCGINMGPVMAYGDRTEIAGGKTRLTYAQTAVIRYRIGRDGTLLAGRPDHLDNIIALLPGLRRRTKPLRQTYPLPDNFPFLIDATAILGKGTGDDLIDQRIPGIIIQIILPGKPCHTLQYFMLQCNDAFIICDHAHSPAKIRYTNSFPLYLPLLPSFSTPGNASRHDP